MLCLRLALPERDVYDPQAGFETLGNDIRSGEITSIFYTNFHSKPFFRTIPEGRFYRSQWRNQQGSPFLVDRVSDFSLL